MRYLICLFLAACACNPTLVFEDEGIPVTGAPHFVADFTGNGVIVSSSVPGIATVNIPGITFLNSGVTVPGGPHTKVSLTGSGVQSVNAGIGRLESTIPGNVTYLPERWFQTGITPPQSNIAMGARTSGFSTFMASHAGFIAGLVTRFTSPIISGSLVVSVTINGVVTLSITHDAGSFPTGRAAPQAPGVSPYAAGDLIGVEFSVDATFSPVTTQLEAAVSVFEQP